MGVSLKGQRCLEDSFEDIFEEDEDTADNEEVTEEDDNDTIGQITGLISKDVEAEDLFILDERIKDATKNALKNNQDKAEIKRVVDVVTDGNTLMKMTPPKHWKTSGAKSARIFMNRQNDFDTYIQCGQL